MDPDPTSIHGCYDLLMEPGERPELVIVVASLGIADRPAIFEWRATMAQAAGGRHVAYLRDRQRSWYNAPDDWDGVIDAITRYCADHGITRITAFGISMGAFGAALLATRLPIAAILLLAPQASIDPDEVAFDNRFIARWQALTDRPRPRLQRVSDTTFLCCFSVDDIFDVSHAAILHRAAPDCHFLPIRGDHNVAVELLSRDQQIPLLTHMLGDAPLPDLRLHMLPLDDLFAIARLTWREDRPALQARADALVAAGHPWHAPGILFPALRWSLRPRKRTLAALLFKLLRRRAWPAHRGMSLLATHIEPCLVEGWADRQDDAYAMTGTRATLRLHLIDADIGPGARIRLVGTASAPGTLRIRQKRALLADMPVDGPFDITVQTRGRLVELHLETQAPAALALTQLRILQA